MENLFKIKIFNLKNSTKNCLQLLKIKIYKKY